MPKAPQIKPETIPQILPIPADTIIEPINKEVVPVVAEVSKKLANVTDDLDDLVKYLDKYTKK